MGFPPEKRSLVGPGGALVWSCQPKICLGTYTSNYARHFLMVFHSKPSFRTPQTLLYRTYDHKSAMGNRTSWKSGAILTTEFSYECPLDSCNLLFGIRPTPHLSSSTQEAKTDPLVNSKTSVIHQMSFALRNFSDRSRVPLPPKPSSIPQSLQVSMFF